MIKNKSLVKNFSVLQPDVTLCITLGLVLMLKTTASNAQYTLYESDYGLLSTGLHVQMASLSEINNRSGDPLSSKLSDIYFEYTIEPNVKFALNLFEESQLYGGFSMIYSAMQGHDPSGITYHGTPYSSREDYAPYPDYKDWMMKEEMYIGLRSGKLIPGLDDNAIDLSAGSQDYKLGTGLLLANGTDDGGFRGSYWIGARTVFVNTMIARLNSNGFKLEGFYLENNPRNPENLKRYTGMNIEYNYKDMANIGFSYINDDHYAGPITAKTNAYDFRADFMPLPSILPNLFISSEFVYQDNNKLTDVDPLDPILYLYGEMGKKSVFGGFAEIQYKFPDLPWQPVLSYRYAAMQKGFDFMNFGFKTWSTWFQGEINGEFISDNTDIITNVLRVVANPRDDVTINLIYLNYKFDDPEVWGITSRHYGNEVDLLADWAFTDSIDFAAGLEAFIPDAGGSEIFGGGNKVWLQGMVYASFKF
ncbi:MAG: alginate export family protein [Methylococcaceae bacterium]|nr:alginate export family protein [Methylococcaceae bacterium]